MADIEDMIGELEDEGSSKEEDEDPEKEEETEEREETFGLDLDSAWSSPDRGEDE